jgi:hypothetical protein
VEKNNDSLDLFSGIAKKKGFPFVILFLSGLWSEDAVELQMSHKESNSVRAAYTHKAKHLEQRRLMLQWWADYLDASRNGMVRPFEFATNK